MFLAKPLFPNKVKLSLNRALQYRYWRIQCLLTFLSKNTCVGCDAVNVISLVYAGNRLVFVVVCPPGVGVRFRGLAIFNSTQPRVSGLNYSDVLTR